MFTPSFLSELGPAPRHLPQMLHALAWGVPTRESACNLPVFMKFAGKAKKRTPVDEE